MLKIAGQLPGSTAFGPGLGCAVVEMGPAGPFAPASCHKDERSVPKASVSADA